MNSGVTVWVVPSGTVTSYHLCSIWLAYVDRSLLLVKVKNLISIGASENHVSKSEKIRGGQSEQYRRYALFCNPGFQSGGCRNLKSYKCQRHGLYSAERCCLVVMEFGCYCMTRACLSPPRQTGLRHSELGCSKYPGMNSGVTV